MKIEIGKSIVNRLFNYFFRIGFFQIAFFSVNQKNADGIFPQLFF